LPSLRGKENSLNSTIGGNDLLKPKIPTFILMAALIAVVLVFPASAVAYNPGVTAGQYVKYGNFVGTGPGAEQFNDYDWLKLQVTDVSGKSVTLLSTSQYKNGQPIAGNGTVNVWNVETGTEDGTPSTQGPIIAANLNQGDSIPPPNTYSVNRTETRNYLGFSRTVNVLDATLATPDYSTTLTYVYDKASGMLLESTTQTTTQSGSQSTTTTISYSVTDTNIFNSGPSPSVPELTVLSIGAIVIALIAIVTALVFVLRKNRRYS
jgi:hypothetical protein